MGFGGEKIEEGLAYFLGGHAGLTRIKKFGIRPQS
jgi:hypothetical protein